MTRWCRATTSTSIAGMTAAGLAALLALSMSAGAQQQPQLPKQPQVPQNLPKKAAIPAPQPKVRQAQPKPQQQQQKKTTSSDQPVKKKEVPKTANKSNPDSVKKSPVVTKAPIPKIDPKKTADPSKLVPKKSADPGKQPIPGSGTPTIPKVTKLPIAPKGTIPGQPTLPSGQKLAVPGVPGSKMPSTVLYKPAPGLKIKPMLPPKIAPANLTLWKPAKPPMPAPKLFGPAWFKPAPKFSWYPWGGKKYFPYFFVGTVVTGAVIVAGYNYWTPPPPSCYAGGSVVYYYPGTRICYDFSVAREDDEFECHGKVFRYRPSRYRTVELMIEDEGTTAVPVSTWAEKEPDRKAQVQSAIDRAAARAKTVAAVPTEKLDCSACLAALGPTEGEDGQATVSVVNNCDHDITVSGGLTKTGASADTPAVCEFQGDVPAGQEVVACTKPTSDFSEAQVFLNAVVPVEGTAKPAPACRIPDQPKAN